MIKRIRSWKENAYIIINDDLSCMNPRLKEFYMGIFYHTPEAGLSTK